MISLHHLNYYAFEDTRWITPVVSKCGCSTLGAIWYWKLTHKLLDKDADVFYSIFPYRKHNRSLLRCSSYRIFVVWRDPFKRLVSLYTELLNNPDAHKRSFIPRTGHTREQLLSDVGLFVRCALYTANHDAHVCTQKESLRRVGMCAEDIDVVVKIEDMKDFVEKELKYEQPYFPRNVSIPDFDASVFEPYREEIENFYREDYELYDKIRGNSGRKIKHPFLRMLKIWTKRKLVSLILLLKYRTIL